MSTLAELKESFQKDIDKVNRGEYKNTLVNVCSITGDIYVHGIVVRAEQYVPMEYDDIPLESLTKCNRGYKVEYAAEWQDVDRRQSRYQTYLFEHYTQQLSFDEVIREMTKNKESLDAAMDHDLQSTCYQCDQAGVLWQDIRRRGERYRYLLRSHYFALHSRFMTTGEAVKCAVTDIEKLDQYFDRKRAEDVKTYWSYQ